MLIPFWSHEVCHIAIALIVHRKIKVKAQPCTLIHSRATTMRAKFKFYALLHVARPMRTFSHTSENNMSETEKPNWRRLGERLRYATPGLPTPPPPPPPLPPPLPPTIKGKDRARLSTLLVQSSQRSFVSA